MNIIVHDQCDITLDELHNAYRAARWRCQGIGFLQAIDSPDLLAGLRITVMAMKRKQQQHGMPAPVQRVNF